MNEITARRRRTLMLVVPGILLAIGATLWLTGGRYTETDNAYVKALTVDVAPEVAGTVKSLAVKANDRVRAGDLLFEIDPADYEIAVRAAEAGLLIEWARVEALRPEMRAAHQEMRKATADADYYAKEVTRLEGLRDKQAVSGAQLDDMRHKRDAALAEAAAYEQEYRRAGVALGNDVNLPKEKHPFYMAAKARLDKAKLDLARTRVVAPQDGVVSNKSISAGDLVAPGHPVMTIVKDSDAWVEANLKETELTDVRVGQPVTVTLDVYPGTEYEGSVESISPATGAEFALLPPQNASGNWVKVVQRVPVRIRLSPKEGQPPLRAGLSAEIRIDTGKRRWQRLYR